MPGKFGKLLALLNECGQPQDYADRAITLWGNPLVIFDASMRVVGITDCDVPDEFYQRMRQDRYPAAELLDNLGWRRKMKSIMAEEGTHEEYVFGATHLTRVLRVQGVAVGQMDLGAYFRELTEEDRELFELVCEICAVSLFHRQTASGLSGSNPLYLLEYLLDGNSLTEEQTRQQAILRDWAPGHTLYVLSLDMFGADKTDSELSLFALLGPSDRAIHYKNCLVIVLSREQALSEAELQRITAILSEIGTPCGLSRSFERLSEIKQYFRQATVALDIGRRVRPDNLLYRYEDFSEYHMVHDVALTAEPRGYVLPELLALAENDTARRQGLLCTLLCYLDSGKSVQATAQRLHLHRNTVNYRISRAAELLHLDFNDGRQLGRLLFSIRILEYLDRKYYFPEA